MKSPLFLKIAALSLAAVAVLATASCSLTGESEEETTTERPAVLLEARPQTIPTAWATSTPATCRRPKRW